jgi:hypothetical protein
MCRGVVRPSLFGAARLATPLHRASLRAPQRQQAFTTTKFNDESTVAPPTLDDSIYCFLKNYFSFLLSTRVLHFTNNIEYSF